MRIDIYNVNHGQCAVVTCPNGRRIMIDCGDRLENGRWWAPSMHFYGQSIDLLALMNLDEDHLSNFELLSRYVGVGQILSNPTIGAGELLQLKKDGMQLGTRAVYRWMLNPFKRVAPALDLGGVQVRCYFNPFIPLVSSETNNLSLVLIIQLGYFKIVFSGDLEASGWRELLDRSPQFAADLAGTSIFVASHHGRADGRCAELFDFFTPEIVVFSDAARQFESQDTDDWYRQRCLGAVVIADPPQRRYVVTTRNDGDMRIDVFPDGSWTWLPVKIQDWEIRPQLRPAVHEINPFGALPGSSHLRRSDFNKP